MEPISIIIPVYNAKYTLPVTLNSILKQTHTLFKLILIDDGSTDGSSEICDLFAKKDERISVIHQKNQGALLSRVTGISMLPLDGYAAFCDADDYLPVDALHKLITLAEQTNADMVCGVSKKLIGTTAISRSVPASMIEQRTYTKDEIRDKIMISYFGVTNFPSSMCAKLYKCSLFKKHGIYEVPVHFFGDDMALNMQVLKHVDRLTVTPEAVYYYRIGGGTSVFMPEFWNDAVSFYYFKRKFLESYTMPRNALYLISFELVNELLTWLISCERSGKYNKEQLTQEIEKCCNTDTVSEAILNIKKTKPEVGRFTGLVDKKDTLAIYKLINRSKLKATGKRVLKNLIKTYDKTFLRILSLRNNEKS